MILVDTSVWVDHLRRGNARLVELLNEDQVAIHPFVIGELSLGSMKNKAEIRSLLSELPTVPMSEHDEVLAAVKTHRLAGTGIGWVDAHLIASALLGHAKLMTSDKALQRAGKTIGVIAS